MTMTNEKLISIWFNDITERPFNKSEKTRDTYAKEIKYFLDFIKKDIVDIDKADVKTYMQSINAGISDSSYNTALSGISSLYKILGYDVRTENIIKNNPTYGVIRVAVKNKEKVPLTQEEERALLQNCKNDRDYAILLMLLSTGVRINELINITLEQYNNRDEYNGIKLVVTKRSKIRSIYLNDKVIAAIEKYLKIRKDGADTLFTSNSGEIMSRTSISRTFKCIATRSGCFTNDRISQIAPHLMRCTCATNMADGGVPVQIVQKMLGHTNLNTTMRYVKVNNDSLKDVMINYSI